MADKKRSAASYKAAAKKGLATRRKNAKSRTLTLSKGGEKDSGKET